MATTTLLPISASQTTDRVEYVFDGTVDNRFRPWRLPWDFVHDVRAMFHLRDMVRVLAITQVRRRFHESALGILWHLLQPLATLVVLAVVFTQVLHRRADIENYYVYLFSGLVPFMIFREMIGAGSQVVIANGNLIKRTNSLLLLYPVSDFVKSLVTGGATLLAMILLVLGGTGQLHALILLVIPAAFLFALFGFGLSLALMTLVMYIRDVTQVIQVVMRAMYFMTPILYFRGMLGEWGWINDINPLTYFVELHHAIIFFREWPSTNDWLVAIVLTIMVNIVGYAVFKWREHDFINWL